jgi:hypothetical protein
MTENEQRLITALDYINADDYDTWIKVGMALKHEGLPLAMWEGWSRRSAKHRDGECSAKWKSFNEDNAGQPVTRGTIVALARQNGYTGRAVTGPISRRAAQPAQRPAAVETLPADYKPETVPDVPTDYDPAADMRRYLSLIFRPEEHVTYCDRLIKQTDKNGKPRFAPVQSTRHRTAREIIDALAGGVAAAGICAQSEGGAYVRFNPMDGKGDGNANVTDYRFCLIESDTDALEKQYGLYKALWLPIAVLVHSGNKSLHAIVRVDAQNAEEYRERVRYIYDYCERHGLHVDKQDRNPSRYSRLPGIKRGDRWQYIVDTNLGAGSFAEWAAWAAVQQDPTDRHGPTDGGGFGWDDEVPPDGPSVPEAASPTPPAPDAQRSVYRAILEAHAKPDFKAAQLAEMAQGEGLDLDIHFYRRRADSADYYKLGENGSEGEPLLFKGINYIAARTGGGKTRFECALAAQTLYKYENAPIPKRVIFFSLEEPAKDIQKHIVTAFVNLKYEPLHKATITEADTTAALLDKLTDDDKRGRIEAGYSDLADRLIVIDSVTFEDAKEKAIEADQELNKETVSGILADVAGDIEKLILDAVAKDGAENVVFFIDYAQMIRDPEGARSAASYQELKAVAQHLKNAAQRNAIMFVGAQVDRSAIKAAHVKNNPQAQEFHSMERENLREAADLEQSANRIIYLTIDDKSMADDYGSHVSYLNMRLLKNRQGTEHLYASAPIHFDRWTIDFAQLTAPTYGDADGHRPQFVNAYGKPINRQDNTGSAPASGSGSQGGADQFETAPII